MRQLIVTALALLTAGCCSPLLTGWAPVDVPVVLVSVPVCAGQFVKHCTETLGGSPEKCRDKWNRVKQGTD